MKYIILHISFLITLCCCQETKLEKALQLAENNRKELEKVLTHYSIHPKDSLKYKAACFLIENMPGHYTKVGNILDSCRHTPLPIIQQKVLDICCGVYLDTITTKLEDTKTITADYLIRHIDSSFKLLEYPWIKELPFEWFLDYVLPYRLEYEQLTPWRDSLFLTTNSAIHEIMIEDKKYDASRITLEGNFSESFSLFDYYYNFFKKNLNSECQYLYLREVFINRAKGLPAVLDFFPYYPNRNGSHYWANILSPYRKQKRIWGSPVCIAAKVYRRTYSHNFDIYKQSNEYIPPFFRDPFNKDVTDEYFYTQDITLNALKHMPKNIRYSYLCVFNSSHWLPIAQGYRKKDTFFFSKMGKGIVYLPIFFWQNNMFPLDYPFALHLNGNIQKFIPDTINTIDLCLYRKYPYSNRVDFSKHFSNITIEGMKYSNSQNYDTLTTWNMTKPQYYIDSKIRESITYRYLRISCPQGCYIADLHFWNKNGEKLQPIETDSTKFITDDNPLTELGSKHKIIILDFGQEVNIARIVCIPRGDGNGIYPENTYELFFYELGGWKSLGRKKANDFYIKYSKVPSNALLWLHNLTTGQEERIFTVENGNIRFW